MKENAKIKLKEIADMDSNFAQWYTDICVKAGLIGYTREKGMFVLRPYGYAIWENIQSWLDKRLKESGHSNVAMPMLIPESLLQKEKDHIEGFAPECAWVTMGGSDKLEERLAVRPTSETLFCDYWSNTVKSWRDLPQKLNQWCSVIRWEKTTRPFLRHREFLWQEGHTLHETAEEAIQETEDTIDLYQELCEDVLAMPVIKGIKTDKEKFAGAERTYTVECMMQDGKMLQAGTSHYFGDGFARAFNIKFNGKDNKQYVPFETSWGISSRLIGGIIMTHSDVKGLVLPPKIAPIQVVIIPINFKNNSELLDLAASIKMRLSYEGIRVKLDSDVTETPGWKYSQYELIGVPLRIEIGPRDLGNGTVTVVRRDTGVKEQVKINDIFGYVNITLKHMAFAMFEKAKELYEKGLFCVTGIKDDLWISEEQTKDNLGTGKSYLLKSGWCGSLHCELAVKEQLGMSSRCVSLDKKDEQDEQFCNCIACGGKAKRVVYWGVAY